MQELTPRERDVYELAIVGFTNPMIAAKLNISTETVKMHLKHIFQKRDVSSRVELVRSAFTPDND